MSNTRVWQGDRVAVNDAVPQSGRMTSALGQSEKRSTEKTANILLVDRSGSTEDVIAQNDQRPKIAGIKEAFTTFIVNSPDSAYISVICFGSAAEVLCDMQVVGQNKSDIIESVQGIMPKGATAMCGAFRLAEEQCRKAPENYLIRIYALTDGLPTDLPRNVSPSQITEKLKKTYQNLQIHAIGFGHGIQIDEGLLRALASCSVSGTPFYYHILDDVKKLTGFLNRQSRSFSL